MTPRHKEGMKKWTPDKKPRPGSNAPPFVAWSPVARHLELPNHVRPFALEPVKGFIRCVAVEAFLHERVDAAVRASTTYASWPKPSGLTRPNYSGTRVVWSKASSCFILSLRGV